MLVLSNGGIESSIVVFERQREMCEVASSCPDVHSVSKRSEEVAVSGLNSAVQSFSELSH